MNVVVFLAAAVPTGVEGVIALALGYGVVPAALLDAPFAHAHRLLTHLFAHGSWAHLLGNMLFLFVFGDNIEDRYGHVPFALFYLGGGVAAAIAQIVVVAGSDVPMIGASGAVSAVLGAYIVLYPEKRVQALVVPLVVPWFVANLLFRTPRFFLWWLPAWLYLGVWVLLQLWEGLGDIAATGGVAWWAHVGGFAFGALVARAVPVNRSPAR